MLFVLIFIVFMYYFTCISFAIRPSGRKSAIKLIGLDWIGIRSLPVDMIPPLLIHSINLIRVVAKFN